MMKDVFHVSVKIRFAFICTTIDKKQDEYGHIEMVE